jgi:DnaJ-class molecular chaperone
MQVKYFKDVTNVEELKQIYRKLAMQHHKRKYGCIKIEGVFKPVFQLS